MTDVISNDLIITVLTYELWFIVIIKSLPPYTLEYKNLIMSEKNTHSIGQMHSYKRFVKKIKTKKMKLKM